MRDPDWYIQHGFESEADQLERAAGRADRDAEIHYPGDDLRDATFLARGRTMDAADTRTPEERERDKVRAAENAAWHARQRAMAWTPRLRCDDCGLTSCDGGPTCRGDMR